MNKALKTIFSSIFILVFALLLIIAGLLYLESKGSDEERYIADAPIPIDEHALLGVANTSLDVVKMLSKGGTITDGPRMVSSIDREKLPSLFAGIEGDIYLMRISSGQKDLFVVMNSTAVLKTVPLTMFSQPQ